MYRYKYNSNYHHKSRRAKRTTALALFFVLLFLGGATYIAVDVFLSRTNTDAPSTQSTYSSVQGASITIVRTPYFQFQLPAGWVEVASESKDKKYVYRNFRHELIEQELVVEIDKAAPTALVNVKTSHVLPVEFNNTGAFGIVAKVAEPCQSIYPNVPGEKTKQDNPRLISQYNVSFACNPGSGYYQVAVGLSGGSEDMNLRRQDGKNEKVNIIYKNVTVSPRPDHLYDIIESFRLF